MLGSRSPAAAQGVGRHAGRGIAEIEANTMPYLDLTDWVFWGRSVALLIFLLVFLKVAYAAKTPVPLPSAKPRLCLLPKYVASLPVEGGDAESDISSRLTQFGFRERRRDEKAIVFARGSALGDFSIKIVKVVVTASLPLTNPAELKIEYGALFGCVCDTGDLWKFSQELTEKMEASLGHPDLNWRETGNPYQSPQT